MDTQIRDPIVLRSRRAPYVVFGVLLVPVILLSVYNAVTKYIIVPIAFPTGLLLIIWWYLYSLKLILDESTILYGVMWRRYQLATNEIASIGRAPKVFGLSGRWLIKRKNGFPDVVVNVANFMPNDIKKFVRALEERAPQIEFRGLGSHGPSAAG
jgi:hypothetical protein